VSDVHLFDPGPVELAPADDPALSAGQRLTLRNAAELAAGRHPATGLPLADGTETCGGCAHHEHVHHHDRHWHKCTQHRLGMSHSAASDIRVSWPACTRFIPIPGGA